METDFEDVKIKTEPVEESTSQKSDTFEWNIVEIKQEPVDFPNQETESIDVTSESIINVDENMNLIHDIKQERVDHMGKEIVKVYFDRESVMSTKDNEIKLQNRNFFCKICFRYMSFGETISIEANNVSEGNFLCKICKNVVVNYKVDRKSQNLLQECAKFQFSPSFEKLNIETHQFQNTEDSTTPVDNWLSYDIKIEKGDHEEDIIEKEYVSNKSYSCHNKIKNDSEIQSAEETNYDRSNFENTESSIPPASLDSHQLCEIEGEYYDNNDSESEYEPIESSSDDDEMEYTKIIKISKKQKSVTKGCNKFQPGTVNENDMIENTPEVNEIISDCINKSCKSQGSDLKVYCKMCPKTFTDSYTLIRHMSTHYKLRPFICNVCMKNFDRKDSLRRHLISHSGKKPFQCVSCSKSYTQSGSLSKHMKTHTGVKPHVCETCGKSFAQLYVLKKHVRRHTGERPFSCSVCDKTFSYRFTLSEHMKLHSGNKPCICHICDKSFSLKSYLNNHMKKHQKKSKKKVIDE